MVITIIDAAMSHGMSTTVERICNEISVRITLKDSVEECKIRAKARRFLHKLLRRKGDLEATKVPAKLLELLCKYFPGAFVKGHKEVSKEEETKDEDDLLERSPIRSPRSPESIYAPYKSYEHLGRQRVQEGAENDQIKAFVQNLQDLEMLRDFTEFCETLPTSYFSDSEDFPDNYLVTNGSYHNNDNDIASQWEAARFDAQNAKPRVPRYSFSSGASSTSSTSPYPSPGPPPMSSPPPSPNYSSRLQEITEGWVKTSVSQENSSPRNVYTNIPVTVTDMSMRDTDSSDPDSPSSCGSECDQRRYTDLRTVRRQHRSPSDVTPTPMKDKLKNLLQPSEMESAWGRIQQLPLEKLASGDSEGDTQLMILLANKTPQQDLYVYYIMERLLKEDPLGISVANKQGKDAMRIAVEDCVDKPYLSAYIAEAFQRANLPYKEYSEKEETILHIIAKLGDEYAPTLKLLLSVAYGGQPAFDVNAQDSTGCTALHCAMKVHKCNLDTYIITQTLLKHGANLLIQEYLNRNTPLHILVTSSADLQLVQTIRSHLEGKSLLDVAAEVINRQNNTILHLACANNCLTLEHHKLLVELLFSFGGRIHLKNINGHVPSYLVDSGRKEEIRAILHGKATA